MTHELTLIRDAQIDVTYFARYFGYLRVSVSMWLNGRCAPHHWRAAQVDDDLRLVKTALDAGLLPVRASVAKGKARYEAIAQALDRAKLLSK